MRISPHAAAKQFVDTYFPDCSAAFLSGSVVNGNSNDHSDLDIVIIDDTQVAPYHECFREFGWPIEAFILTSCTYLDFFDENERLANPSLQRMCAYGVSIRDNGIGDTIREEAARRLAEGPPSWNLDEMNRARYEITDYLTDLVGCGDYKENIFTVSKLSKLVHNFIMRVNDRWVGEGKWIVRELRLFDEALCRRYIEAFESFYKEQKKEPLVQLIDDVLSPYGGRLFEGYRIGGQLVEEDEEDEQDESVEIEP